MNKEILEVGYTVDPAYLAMFLSTDYGYNQVIGKTYGGVVDENSDKDIESIKIALLKNKNLHDRISKLVRTAYTLKDSRSTESKQNQSSY